MKIYVVVGESWTWHNDLEKEIFGIYDDETKAEKRCSKLNETRDKYYVDKFKIIEYEMNKSVEGWKKVKFSEKNVS